MMHATVFENNAVRHGRRVHGWRTDGGKMAVEVRVVPEAAVPRYHLRNFVTN